MSDLRELGRASYREARNLPDVVSERCVHTLIETASCQACVDVCPQDAWVLDDEQLGIDASRCDGCNLCVATCPEGAIQADMPPALKSDGGHKVAMLACEPAGAAAGDEGVVPCLHAIGLNTVMALYRTEVDTLISCSSDCDNCARGSAPRLELCLERFNQLLRERKLPTMHHRHVDLDEWLRLADKGLAESGGPSMSRRQFFRRATQAAIAEHGHIRNPGAMSNRQFEPAGRIIPRRTDAQTVPFLPQIDPGRCNACDACARLCPHGAIVVEKSDPPGSRSYLINPDQCTGCGICEDVCDQQAVSVTTWATPSLLRIPLNPDRCHGCGVTYYTPAGKPSPDHQCRICALTRNHRLLYQVLD